MAARATGGPGGRTHLISNYTEENNCSSLAVERTALAILESALISAEIFIRVRKQRKKNQIERERTAAGTKITPKVYIFYYKPGDLLLRKTSLKTEGTVLPNTDRQRVWTNQISGFQGSLLCPLIKSARLYLALKKMVSMFPSSMRKIHLHGTIPASIQFVTSRAMFENSASITLRWKKAICFLLEETCCGSLYVQG